MTRSPLPHADPLLVADTVAALPARLRAKLDDAVALAADWDVDGDVVRLPGGAEVTLAPQDGVLRAAEQVRCGCLLAPACLHRASVLAAAPVAEDVPAGEPAAEPAAEPAPEPGTAEGGKAEPAAGASAVGASDGWRAAEQRAATVVATAAGRILDAGLPGAGAAVQSDLLRAVHHARVEGLHRLAAAATRVVTAVRAGRDEDPAFRLRDLTGDLLDVLETAHLIATGRGDPAAWRGTARTEYAPVGSLRLTGLCLEPVLTDSGYAGVVVWLVDPSGGLWSVPDVRPGGPERISSAAHGPVAVGETGLTHRALSRSGMVVSGATANADGRLGAGKGVRAVSAPGTVWSQPPLRPLFGTGRAGPLMLLDLTLCGAVRNDLIAIDVAGTPLRLTVPRIGGTTAFRENLRLLAEVPGLRLLAVGRPSPDRPGAVELLAVGGEDVALPATLGGHADLGLDRLSPAWLRPSGPAPPLPDLTAAPDPLDAFTRRHERVVSGGRLTLTVPGSLAAVGAETAALRQADLRAGAKLLTDLVTVAQPGERDVFGRLVAADSDALARQWLAAGVYLRSFREQLRVGREGRRPA